LLASKVADFFLTVGGDAAACLPLGRALPLPKPPA
jgi:hypothetical protein